MRPAWSYYVFSYQADPCRTFMPIYLCCALCNEFTLIAEGAGIRDEESGMASPGLLWALWAQLLL